MKIYTSYFAKISKLSEDGIVPIAICGKSPEWYGGMSYPKLAPKYHFFKEWKETHDNDYYIRHFNEEVLQPLTPERVVSELEKLSGGKDVALICYEKPNSFCHRYLVASWLNAAGYQIREY